LNVVKRPRDRVALLILLDCGVRRSELTGMRVRDIDMSRRTLTVHGKGQKSRVIPLRGRVVLELEQYLLTPLETVGRAPEPDDYLLYPEYNRRVGKENRVVGGDPKKRITQPSRRPRGSTATTTKATSKPPSTSTPCGYGRKIPPVATKIRLEQAVDGGGGNRTRVHGCTGGASTSVVCALVSPAGRLADGPPSG